MGANGVESQRDEDVDAQFKELQESYDAVKDSDTEAQLAELMQIYEAVKDRALAVENIRVQGLARTSRSILERELTPIRDAATLQELQEALATAHASLTRLGIFDDLSMTIEEGSPDRSDTCNVLVECAEKTPMSASAGTYLQGSEGSIQTTVSLKNLLGHAEALNASFECSTSLSKDVSVAVSQPRFAGLPISVQGRVHQQFRNFAPESSFTERLRGAAVSASSDDSTHTVAYELAWRQVAAASEAASRPVQAQAGHALKSAVSYSYLASSLDHPTFPLSGFGFRSTSEVAGLGPDSHLLRYAKQHFQGLGMWALAPGAVLALGAEAGVLAPWGPGWRTRATPISDRFFLGGIQNNLRGFSHKRAGPCGVRGPATHDADQADGEQRFDALGGDIVGSVMAALRFRLPNASLDTLGIFGHVFLNGGSLVRLGQLPAGVQPVLTELGAAFRWTVGAGLVWPVGGFGNMEINFCRVLRSQATDEARTGVHFGFVISPW